MSPTQVRTRPWGLPLRREVEREVQVAVEERRERLGEDAIEIDFRLLIHPAMLECCELSDIAEPKEFLGGEPT